ncbi:MAG: GNAT family N-acetyltransferase [Clostridia bacterium]|nr:GNAT family N-acetyltransferase [Clostridia bacterium]
MFTMKNGTPYEIRKAKVSDAEKLIQYINTIAGESDNLTFGIGEFEMTIEKEEVFLRSYEDHENAIMLLALVEDEIISCMSYEGGRRPRVRHVGEFGISVSEKYWNQGVGYEMLKQLISWAEQSKYCEKMNLKVREDNEKAIHLYEKMGFVKEGLLLKDMKINGEFTNCYFMGRDIEKK